MNRFALAALLLLTFSPLLADAPPPAPAAPKPGVAMNNHYLEQTLRSMTSEIEGEPGRWMFTWFDTEMMLVTDEPADRMRIIAPIAESASLDAEMLRFLMEVNFERALDAKYAIWENTLWATYVHPLSSLTVEEFKAGARQVTNLVNTYGTEFTSTGMSFGGGN